MNWNPIYMQGAESRQHNEGQVTQALSLFPFSITIINLTLR